MRLVLAVVARDDLAPLLIALARGGFTATVFQNAMHLLETDAGLMIGVPEARVSDVLATIRSVCRARPRPTLPLVPGLSGLPAQEQSGGALCIILKVARFERLG